MPQNVDFNIPLISLFLILIGATAPQAGQADYSQQWAEYYRSMGMIKEAEAIEMRVWRYDCYT